MIDLNASTLSVAVNHNPPFTVLVSRGDHVVLAGGSDARLLATVAHALNFLVHVVDCGGQWGSLNGSSGAWTGIVGALQQGRADVGMSELSLTHFRWRAIAFSEPYAVSSLSFVTSGFPNRRFFARPHHVFAAEVWAALALSLLLLSVVLGARALWPAVGALLAQPSAVWSRAPTWSWPLITCFLLSGHVLSRAFSQHLMALWAFPVGGATVDSLAALLSARDLRVLADRRSSAAEMLRNADTRLLRALSARLVLVSDAQLAMAVDRPTALISGEEQLRLLAGMADVHWPRLREESVFFLDLICFGFRKEFSFSTHFNQITKRLKENGFLALWNRQETRRLTAARKHTWLRTETTPTRVGAGPQVTTWWWVWAGAAGGVAVEAGLWMKRFYLANKEN